VPIYDISRPFPCTVWLRQSRFQSPLRACQTRIPPPEICTTPSSGAVALTLPGEPNGPSKSPFFGLTTEIKIREPLETCYLKCYRLAPIIQRAPPRRSWPRLAKTVHRFARIFIYFRVFILGGGYRYHRHPKITPIGIASSSLMRGFQAVNGGFPGFLKVAPCYRKAWHQRRQDLKLRVATSASCVMASPYWPCCWPRV
jgi:hypothetical protein